MQVNMRRFRSQGTVPQELRIFFLQGLYTCIEKNVIPLANLPLAVWSYTLRWPESLSAVCDLVLQSGTLWDVGRASSRASIHYNALWQQVARNWTVFCKQNYWGFMDNESSTKYKNKKVRNLLESAIFAAYINESLHFCTLWLLLLCKTPLRWQIQAFIVNRWTMF